MTAQASTAPMDKRKAIIEALMDLASRRAWHEIEITDRRHDPGIGLLLCRDQQRPVGGVGDVLEQVDRRKGAADDPDSALPLDMTDSEIFTFRHQPPRSASR